ncbi:MAG: acyl-CoA/acyl-ACP dehydrogenase [Proteobacteria bacterium]|nr:acyl-CoA/acyl-ACP dehydrogenase [Pseudomonadota bacterium]
MDFNFSEEQRMMAGALRELAADLSSGERLRAIYDGTDSADRQRWDALAELGLFSVLAPQGSGGMSLTDSDFILLAEEAGHAALPVPLCEQAGVAVPLLAELAGGAADSGTAAALAEALQAAASGASRVAVAHPINPFTLAPADPTHWLVCNADTVRLLEAREVKAVPEPTADAGRLLYRLEAPLQQHGVTVRGAAAAAAAARAAQRGALYAAAQSVGVAQRLTDIAVSYACERVQFGKPIGAYQAIKHHLANVQVKLEFARPVVYAAATRVADPDAGAQAAVSHAALAAAAAADLAARTAIQVHGAMGYSWEVDLHFYMKRAWALAGSWGAHSFHARRIQALVCGGELTLGPGQTFE